MSRDSPSGSKPDSIGEVIREFRKDLSLTQAQFATAAGITPTTVYRYEAGTNFPTNDILAKLLQLAVKRQALKSVEVLGKLLAERSSLFLLDGTDQGVQPDSPIYEAMLRLPLEKQLEIMAAVLMLQEGVDETALRIFKNLVEPWSSKAKEAFGPAILRSEFAGKRSKSPSPKKERR